jgi:hypothetical protein
MVITPGFVVHPTPKAQSTAKSKFLYLWSTQFHVDNLSSAHVYLRLRDGETWDQIPQSLLEDCAQLTKANSIEGQPWSTSVHVTGYKSGR